MPGDQQDDAPPIAKWLTVPGRLLLIITIAGSGGLFCVYFLESTKSLPGGSYPIVIWLVPVGMAGFAFFKVTAFLLEKAGVKIYQKP